MGKQYEEGDMTINELVNDATNVLDDYDEPDTEVWIVLKERGHDKYRYRASMTYNDGNNFTICANMI